jgi:hypothetical protein
MKDKITLIGFALIVVAFIAAGIGWDVYKWKTFQEVTQSDIGYFKWKFVIEDGNSNVKVRLRD